MERAQKRAFAGNHPDGLYQNRYSDRQMVSYRIFLLKQEKFGGYQDKIEAKSDLNVNVKMGKNMEESDFA